VRLACGRIRLRTEAVGVTGRLVTFRLRYQRPQIQQVLRLKCSFRPPASRFHFHSNEVPDLAVHAIPHVTNEFVARGIPPNLGSERQGNLKLQTSPSSRDILQQTHDPPLFSLLVFPGNLHHISAHHSYFRSPFAHIAHIGGATPNFTARASAGARVG